MDKHPRRRAVSSSGRRVISVTLTDKDREMLEWLTEVLNISKSEVIRAAFRNYAAQMSGVERELKKRKSA